MKALTLTQPWASLMQTRAKTIETRSWPTSYRGDLVIHSSKKFPEFEREMCFNPFFEDGLDYVKADNLPLGYGICVVRIIGCVKTTELHKAEFILGRKPSTREILFGNYSENRYAWLTEYVRKLDNIGPIKGAQGLWEWGSDVEQPYLPEERKQRRAEDAYARGETTL